jgi:hypothetical protein
MAEPVAWLGPHKASGHQASQWIGSQCSQGGQRDGQDLYIYRSGGWGGRAAGGSLGRMFRL